MDKVLAFSILSASPADVAAGAGRWTKLSWRRSAAGDHHAAEPASKADAEEQGRGPRSGRGAGERAARAGESGGGVPRFAPEFDGIDCFETIVAH